MMSSQVEDLKRFKSIIVVLGLFFSAVQDADKVCLCQIADHILEPEFTMLVRAQEGVFCCLCEILGDLGVQCVDEIFEGIYHGSCFVDSF